MNTPYVVLEKATKQYGTQKAVNEVDLTLHAGECVGLAGHNGAGKSTIIKLILGLIRPDSGQVKLLGEHTSSRAGAQIRSQIGYLPETVALHPSLTGKETLDFYAKLKQQPISQNIHLLARVGIAQAANKRVGAYSKGMRQRLALAQALLGQPKVLLFDEPTTGLDPASRQMFYQIIRELKSEGATILLSTHALAELDGHADRIIVMKNGIKVADGNINQLQAQSGLPVQLKLSFANPNAANQLSTRWKALSDGLSFAAKCSLEEKMQLLNEINNLKEITDIEVKTPSLDEMYAQFLQREDI